VIGEILNLTTLTTSSQSHIVYDDWFSTIYNQEHELTADWGELLIHNWVWVLPNDVVGPPLYKEWLDSAEIKQRDCNSMQCDLKLASHILRPSAKQSAEQRTRQQMPFTMPTYLAWDFKDVSASTGENYYYSPLQHPTEGGYSSPICKVWFQEAYEVSESLDQSQEALDASRPIPFCTTCSGRLSKPPKKLSPDASRKTYSSICQIFELEELLVDPVSYLADTFHPLSLAFKHHDADSHSFSDALSGPLCNVFSNALSNEVKN